MPRSLTSAAVVLALLLTLPQDARAQCVGTEIITVVHSTDGFIGFEAFPTINNAGEAVVNAVPAAGVWRLYRGTQWPLTLVNDNFITFGRPSVNDDGLVAFRVTSSGVGIYTRLENTGPLTTIANSFGGMGTSYSPPGINNAGVVAFRAQPSSATGLPLGIYTSTDGVTYTSIADVTGPFSSFPATTKVSINENGLVSFLAGLDAGGAGLFVGDGSSVTTIVDSSTFFSFTPGGLNDSGVLAFIGSIVSADPGVFTGDGTTVNTIATLSTTPYTAFHATGVSISNDGTVVFKADVGAPSIHGVFTGPDPVADKIIMTGDALSGSTVTGVEIGSECINDAGEIIFRATLADGNSGVYIYRMGVDNEPPVCNAGPGYTAECEGLTTTIALDGTGSSDPDDDELTYYWETDCPGGFFDDETSPTPLLTVDTSCACAISCSVTLTVTDECDESDTCVATVEIADTTAPVIVLNGPDEVTVECQDTYTELGATVVDDCDTGLTSVTIGGDTVDTATPGVYIVTYDAVDASGNEADQVIRTVIVEDTTAPVITLNGPEEITLECHVDEYTELGATVSDACDTGLTAVTIGGDTVDPDSPGVYIVTYDAVDADGNEADQVIRTVIVEDTLPPVVELPTTSIEVVDTACEGAVAVDLPEGTATDLCDTNLAPPTNDAPALFPAGETTIVTYTATDASGNEGTAELAVTVRYGSTIEIDAIKHTVGQGAHPGSSQEPLVGIDVHAFDRTAGSCAAQQGISWQQYPNIVANCTPVNSGVTDANGDVTIDVPPGQYLVLGVVPTDDGPEYLSATTGNMDCGDVQARQLRLLVMGGGKGKPGKSTVITGSFLLIVEPEYVLWDEEEQSYPFVFEALGDWTVTASVEPPEGFVSDHESLTTQAADDIKAVQFTITEVGSDLSPTKTTFEILHNGRRRVIRSNVDIVLTPDYARSRGFDVEALRAKNRIKDRGPRGGTGDPAR